MAGRAARADHQYVQVTRTHARTALIGLLAAAATACGPASSNGSSTPAASSPPVKPAKLVSQLLPTTIVDTTTFRVRAEKLKDQLAPAGVHGRVAVNRRMKAAWLASKEAVFKLVDAPGVVIAVDVNLFRSARPTVRIYHDEVTLREPHETVVRELLPATASPGSAYYCVTQKGFNGCELDWRQGAVITHVLIIGKGTTVPSRQVAAALAPRLLRVQVQMANRIFQRTHVLPGS